MKDPFDSLVPDARSFLGDLAQNNTRDWFLAHKADYDTRLRAPALALLDTLSAFLEKQAGTVPQTKLFRPNRDIRFSSDKTPYHTHLHMLWNTPPIGWFFGISPDYVSIGAGAMGFDKQTLPRWRTAMDGPKGIEVANLLDALTRKGARISEPELKRVPAPFDKAHAHGDLLRRKSLSVWFDLSEADIKKGGLTQQIEAAFSEMLPLGKMLQSLL